MKYEKSCGAVIFRRTDVWNVLLIRHNKGRHVSFPKGHVEPGETESQTAEREIFEETGLRLRHPRYCGIITFVSDRWEGEYMHLFHAEDFSGELRDCDEGVLEWVPKEKARALPQWAGDRIFLALMERRVPFFSLKLRYEGEALREAVLNGEPLSADLL